MKFFVTLIILANLSFAQQFKYKQRTEIDFEGVDVDGQLIKPYGLPVFGRKASHFSCENDPSNIEEFLNCFVCRFIEYQGDINAKVPTEDRYSKISGGKKSLTKDEILFAQNQLKKFYFDTELEQCVTSHKRYREQVVSQTSPQNDVVFIVDSSSSMNQDKEMIANNIGAFIDPFLASGINLNLGMVTTDFNRRSDFLRFSNGAEVLTGQEGNIIELFAENYTKKQFGGGTEKFFDIIIEILRRKKSNRFEFPRKSSHLTIFILTDEPDATPKDGITLNKLRNSFDGAPVTVHIFAPKDKGLLSFDKADEAFFQLLAKSSNGIYADNDSIGDPAYVRDELSDMAWKSVEFDSSFVLSHKPSENDPRLSVTMDGRPVDASKYQVIKDGSRYLVKFAEDFVQSSMELFVSYLGQYEVRPTNGINLASLKNKYSSEYDLLVDTQVDDKLSVVDKTQSLNITNLGDHQKGTVDLGRVEKLIESAFY